MATQELVELLSRVRFPLAAHTQVIVDIPLLA